MVPSRRSALYLERQKLSSTPLSNLLGELTSKSSDLLPDNVNASIVAGVEFKHHLPHILAAVYLPGEGEDSGCLSGSGRAIEEKVR